MVRNKSEGAIKTEKNSDNSGESVNMAEIIKEPTEYRMANADNLSEEAVKRICGEAMNRSELDGSTETIGEIETDDEGNVLNVRWFDEDA